MHHCLFSVLCKMHCSSLQLQQHLQVILSMSTFLFHHQRSLVGLQFGRQDSCCRFVHNPVRGAQAQIAILHWGAGLAADVCISALLQPLRPAMSSDTRPRLASWRQQLISVHSSAADTDTDTPHAADKQQPQIAASTLVAGEATGNA